MGFDGGRPPWRSPLSLQMKVVDNQCRRRVGFNGALLEDEVVERTKVSGLMSVLLLVKKSMYLGVTNTKIPNAFTVCL